MSIRLRIFELQFDDSNTDEAAAHRVTPREIRQVLDNAPSFFRNKKKHKAPYVMIGKTYGGRMLTVPLARTSDPSVWRPATAFDSDSDEHASYLADRGERQ